VATEAEWRRTSASTNETCRVTSLGCNDCDYRSATPLRQRSPERVFILLTEENGQGAFSAAVSLFRLTVAAF